MIRRATAKLALAATIGLGSTHLSTPAIAAQFDQAEVDQSRFIAIAAPIGNGTSHKLLILEQLSNNRPCWQENPGQVTTVDPLLLNFDFTNICARSTDSNGYSVRTGGEDLSLRYQLAIVRRGNDLVLLAASTRTPNAPMLEIGRTRGVTNQFAKIYLNPGWRLARRTYQGQAVGHIYLTTDQPLSTLLATAKQPTSSPGNTLPPDNGSIPVGNSLPVQPVQTGSPRPVNPAVVTTKPQPIPARPMSSASAVVVQALPVDTTPASVPVISTKPVISTNIPRSDGAATVPPVEPLRPMPAQTLPASNPSSIAITVPQPERPTIAPPTAMSLPTVGVMPTRLPVPNVTPPSSMDQTPPIFTPVVSGSGLPNPPALGQGNSNASASASYRVIVQTTSPEQQNQVRSLVPGAFRTTVNGQSVMQAGVFRDRRTADTLQQKLQQQNLPAVVLTNALVEVRVPDNSGSVAPVAVQVASVTSLPGFNLPAPNTSRLQATSLWATYYYLHQAQTIAQGNPLYDPAGNHLGAELSDRDWCAAALQGSVVISDGGRSLGTFNYGGRGNNVQVNCAAFYPTLRTVNATSRSRFVRSNTPFGEGVKGNQLVPYRTVAVDPNLIAIGSVLYIPAARGVEITLPSGERTLHDGYFYAADVGGAVQGNHIDVFIGPATTNPFNFVRSQPSGTFQAFLVNDPAIQTQLASLHKPVTQTAQRL